MMQDNPQRLLHHFSLEISRCEFPLLLGLSGGPDSRALFELIQRLSLPVEVAHIDHGWREESALEAMTLLELCQKHQIPFHLKKLTCSEQTGNLEDAARKARYDFFKEVCLQNNLQGVLVAHHADDQAETVLKRIFEGASLPKLKGLHFKSVVHGLCIYRPLLKFKKKTLISWLDDQQISYFQDHTNEDRRYLRPRLRCDLLPTLSQKFGKQIGNNLHRIGEAAAELEEFLESKLAFYRKQVKVSAEGIYLDLRDSMPETAFEQKAVIRDFFDVHGISISHSVLETILFHLHRCSASVIIQIGQRRVRIKRRIVRIDQLL